MRRQGNLNPRHTGRNHSKWSLSGGARPDSRRGSLLADHGRSVVLLEKNPQLGGSTALAIGSMAAAGTSVQRDKGIDDSPEAYLADLAKVTPAMEPRNNMAAQKDPRGRGRRRRRATAAAGDQLLRAEPDAHYPVPRMHIIVPGTKACIAKLAKVALRRGCRIETQRQVKRAHPRRPGKGHGRGGLQPCKPADGTGRGPTRGDSCLRRLFEQPRHQETVPRRRVRRHRRDQCHIHGRRPPARDGGRGRCGQHGPVPWSRIEIHPGRTTDPQGALPGLPPLLEGDGDGPRDPAQGIHDPRGQGDARFLAAPRQQPV